MKAKTLGAALLAIAGLLFGGNSYAADCSPKAEVHQQRAQNIQSGLRNGRIPSAEDIEFVACMLPEKEDKAAFRLSVQQMRNQQQAIQQQEEAKRLQAINAHSRPATAEEVSRYKASCESGIGGRTGVYRDEWLAECIGAWSANPHSRCSSPDNLPCGSVREDFCYTPRFNACVNGREIAAILRPQSSI